MFCFLEVNVQIASARSEFPQDTKLWSSENDSINVIHTPGPWHCEGEFVYSEHPMVRIADTTVADGDEDLLSDEVADANAALIAVAPEMLEVQELEKEVGWETASVLVEALFGLGA